MTSFYQGWQRSCPWKGAVCKVSCTVIDRTIKHIIPCHSHLPWCRFHYTSSILMMLNSKLASSSTAGQLEEGALQWWPIVKKLLEGGLALITATMERTAQEYNIYNIYILLILPTYIVSSHAFGEACSACLYWWRSRHELKSIPCSVHDCAPLSSNQLLQWRGSLS